MPPQFSPQENLSVTDEERITYFALTDSRGKRTPFGIKKKDRDRHTYVIGKTGMGKSTLLENMAVQDIQRGEGLCFIDPHGSTAEKLMEYIPEERVKDVLYFAPFDLQYPISFNVLENVDADKRHFVVAGLMSTFEKIWVDAWSARMAYILQNTLAALLEFPGATLLGVNRMYIDKEYRKNVIAKITDPSVRSFWVDEYSKYTDRYTQEATPAIQNKIGQFAANALVRNIIGQEQSAFDMRDLMDHKKIFIVNLSKGRVGEGNTNLLGSMLITKLYLAAMSRADASPATLRQLPYFYLYVDEFQNFANKSFADILSESRKYKLALTIAHQYVEQMEEEVAAAVFGNVGTMMAFRVGAYDAEVLEKEFAPTFMMEDLVNLGARQVYLKLMIDGISSQPFSAVTMPPIPEPEVSHRDRAIAYSRATFSRPRAEVEKDISDWVGKKFEDPEAEEKERARLERKAQRDAEGTPSTSATGAGTAPSRAPRENMSSSPRPYRGDTDRTPSRPAQTTPRTYGAQKSSEGPRVYRREDDRARPQYQSQSQGAQSASRVSSETSRSEAPRDTAPVRPHGGRPVRTNVSRPQEPRTQSQTPQSAPQEPQRDLRDILARLRDQSQKNQAPKPMEQEKGEALLPTPAIDTSTPPPERSAPAPQAASAQAVKPARDDGKGVTTEGRESLRALLESVSARKPQQQADTAPTPPARHPILGAPAPKTPPATQAPVPDRNTPPMPHKPAAHTERLVPDNDLRKMLHVPKPDL